MWLRLMRRPRPWRMRSRSRTASVPRCGSPRVHLGQSARPQRRHPGFRIGLRSMAIGPGYRLKGRQWCAGPVLAPPGCSRSRMRRVPVPARAGSASPAIPESLKISLLRSGPAVSRWCRGARVVVRLRSCRRYIRPPAAGRRSGSHPDAEEGAMRFGCCCGPENIAIVAQAGFDFCELPAAVVRPFEEEREALPALRAVATAALRPESFNVLIPASLPLLGPQADRAALERYARRAFGRMAQLGAAVAVLGSGAARHVPDDLPREQALDQLAECLAMLGDIACQAGLDLALEHLNRKESNVFTSLAECVAFLTERGLAQVHVLADLYHLEVEHEALEVVQRAAPLLAHVHVAGGGRRA